MAEIIHCPSCQRKLQVPETLIGQDVQCPSCSATFVGRVSGTPPPMLTRPREPAQDRWEEDRQADVGRPLRDQRPYEDDEFATDYRRRRRDMKPHRGGMILIFGIMGLVFCGIFGAVAWIMGNTDLSEIRAGRMDPEGEGLTQAGKICGILGSMRLVFELCCAGLMVAGGGR